MAGSTLRRTVLCLVVVALLLPLASAWAAPVRDRESGWSRILLAPVSSLVDLFRSAFEADDRPPGHQPGNGDPTANGDTGGPKQREGNGFDPHGKP